MKIIGGSSDAGVMFEAFDAAGFDVNHVIDVLEFPFDDQEGFLSNHEALDFK